MSTPHVYTAISNVMARLAKDGIGKDQKNDSQGYSFRGIDDVYNALAPILSSEGLCILPLVKSKDVTERVNKHGTVIFSVSLHVDYAMVSAKDGSSHVISVAGEAMDSGDKATNKAMSAAFKYACIQAFCIPTEGDNDADKTTHEVAAKATPATKPTATVAKVNPRAEEKHVGPDEVASITALAEAAGVDLATICGKYGISDIQHLPLAKTAEVTSKLQARIAKQAKEAA